LIHHKVYDVWQQPGGHWEQPEPDPFAAAKREAVEETDVKLGEYLPIDATNMLVPLDIGTHAISPRPDKNEPAHWHYDFRYTFVAANESLEHQEREVHAAEWVALNDPRIARIERLIIKLRQQGYIS
jgi:8-oxo-dGTP pyrophosphatase MutT (NUDIX family)